jgi:hypothetical protein
MISDKISIKVAFESKELRHLQTSVLSSDKVQLNYSFFCSWDQTALLRRTALGPVPGPCRRRIADQQAAARYCMQFGTSAGTLFLAA